MTVDEILATGLYTDRRGREWAALGEAWVILDPWLWANKPKRETMTVPEMRLLIERDIHRGECIGGGGVKRLLRRLFGKRYARGGEVPPFTYDRAAKLHGAEGVFVWDGRLIYWKEIE